MGPTEYCTTVPKSSQNLRRVSLMGPGILDCRIPWVFLLQGRAWRTTHLTTSRSRFQLSDLQVLWSWQHRLRIWALLSVIRDLAFAARRWISETHIGEFLWKQGLQDEYLIFLSPVLRKFCPVLSMYGNLFLSMLIFTHCSSTLMFSSHGSCMAPN
jgi:hypothetical protein